MNGRVHHLSVFAGLIISALVGIRVGKRLDTHGPRAIMTAGAAVGVRALALLGAA